MAAVKLNFLMTVHARLAYCHTRLLTKQVETLCLLYPWCATNRHKGSRPDCSLVFGRVALVGDAASRPRPHMGFGVSKAGAEAQALAEALSSYVDVDQALTAYNSVRRPLSEHGRANASYVVSLLPCRFQGIGLGCSSASLAGTKPNLA